MSEEIGICELCGEHSDQIFGTGGKFLRHHILCTTCEDVLANELLALDDQEIAGKAYDRARTIISIRKKTSKKKENGQ